MPREELAALVTAARKRAGYDTIYAFCKATGLPLTNLQEIEAGNRSPTIETLEKIMDAIGWEVTIAFQPKPKRKK